MNLHYFGIMRAKNTIELACAAKDNTIIKHTSLVMKLNNHRNFVAQLSVAIGLHQMNVVILKLLINLTALIECFNCANYKLISMLKDKNNLLITQFFAKNTQFAKCNSKIQAGVLEMEHAQKAQFSASGTCNFIYSRQKIHIAILHRLIFLDFLNRFRKSTQVYLNRFPCPWIRLCGE